tara:strand:+ start:2414 stop:2644 length:231 start_codon:yes stop_codon:yes gene_type:complete
MEEDFPRFYAKRLLVVSRDLEYLAREMRDDLIGSKELTGLWLLSGSCRRLAQLFDPEIVSPGPIPDDWGLANEDWR